MLSNTFIDSILHSPKNCLIDGYKTNSNSKEKL